MSTQLTPSVASTDDRVYVESLIREIVEECPQRGPATDQERQAQEILQRELESRGVRTHLVPFRFNRSLYAVLAMHFAVGLAGSVMYFFQPWVALALHFIAGLSYLCEASHWGYILRRVFPFHRSHNLIGVLPAKGKPRLRIVMLGHADAAHTGLMFQPAMVSGTSNKPYPQPFGFVRKHMLFAVVGFFGLGLIDLLKITTGEPLPLLFYGLTIGTLIGFLLNMQVVLQNTLVPGASNNLSGCVALPVLAQRFADKKPDDVELVFVASGCEESGVGGSAALAHRMRRKWDKDNTVVLGLDILCHGKLSYKTVNEVIPMGIPAWLVETLQSVAAEHPEIGELGIYDACAGTDDAVPFVAKGYDGICIACSDPTLGVSRHYHLPSDSPENVDYEQLVSSINYTEDVVEAIIERRGPHGENPTADRRRIISRLDEKIEGAYALLLHPAAWLVIGLAVGVYVSATLTYDWATLLNGFRMALSALLILFPIVAGLDWLGWNPDKHIAGNLLVFAVLGSLIVTTLGLFLVPLAVISLPTLGIAAGVPTQMALISSGLLCGALIAGLLWLVRR